MLHFSRNMMILIWALCLGAIIVALPNLLPETVRQSLPSWWPNKALSLGLDLRGGSYLLLEADVEELKQDWLKTIEADVRQKLRAAKIGYSGLGRAGGQVRVRVLKPEDLDRALTELKSLAKPIGGSVFTGASKLDLDVTKTEDGAILIAPTVPAINDRITSGMSAAIETVRRRVDQLGTTEPSIQRQGASRIVVQVPGFENPEQLKAVIGTTAKLSFHEVDLSKTVKDAETTGVPPGSVILEVKDPEGPPKMLVKEAAVVQGDDLVDSQPSFDQRSNEPIVSFRFNTNGARRFGKYTQENVGRPFAIVLDDKVISAPVIRDAILGGSGQISGNFSVDEANNLAILLRSGALPTSLTVVEERSIGPSLGADSIRSGLIAGLVGSLAVILFMLVAYALFGVFANIAVIIHVFIIVALMTLFGSTLTLPGIAGLVLSVGMAVDANVLIYERIREEIRSGKTTISAIEAGFRRAYATILDSQVTTLVAGIVMFWLGSGPVRGFAVTLTLGVATTIFTSVTVTRLLVSLWLRRQKSRQIHVPI